MRNMRSTVLQCRCTLVEWLCSIACCARGRASGWRTTLAVSDTGGALQAAPAFGPNLDRLHQVVQLGQHHTTAQQGLRAERGAAEW
jgi:hypothetical protein